MAVGLALLLRSYWRRSEDTVTMPDLVAPTASGPSGAPVEPESLALVDWLLRRAFEQTKVKVADDPMARQRVVEAAQKARAELRRQHSVTISLPFLTADASGPKHFEVRVTRETLDELARSTASDAGDTQTR